MNRRDEFPTHGALTRRDGFDAVRVAAREKMEADFAKSNLHSPDGVKSDKNITNEILLAAEITKKVRMSLLFQDPDIRNAVYDGLVPPDALELFHAFADKGGKLVVMISSIAVGPMAMLRSIQSRYKSYGFGNEGCFKVRFHDVNGRDQMRSLVRSGPEPDFLIAPDGAFSMNEADVHDEYRLLMPFFFEDQYLLHRKDHNHAKGGKVWTFPRSSAETMVRAWMTKKKPGAATPKPLLIGMKVVDCEAKDIPKIAANLEPQDMIVVWEPLASQVIRDSQLRHKNDRKAPVLERVADSWFPVVFSLSAHERWEAGGGQKLRFAIEEVLVGEWNFCRNNFAYAWRLLENDLEFLQWFASGAGFEIPRIPEVVHTDRWEQDANQFSRSDGPQRSEDVRSNHALSKFEEEPDRRPGSLHSSRMRLNVKKRLVDIDGCQIKLSYSQFALILTLAKNFTEDDDEATQLDVIRVLPAALRGLLSKVPMHQEHNARKTLATLLEANEEHDTEPISKLLNDLRRQGGRRRGDEKMAAELLSKLLPKGSPCNLKMVRECIEFE
jgi:hypothetical protein